MGNKSSKWHVVCVCGIIVLIVLGLCQYFCVNHALSNCMSVYTEQSVNNVQACKDSTIKINPTDVRETIRHIQDNILDGNITAFLITLVFSVLAVNVFAVQKDIRDLMQDSGEIEKRLDEKFQKKFDDLAKETEERLRLFGATIKEMQTALAENRVVISNDISSADVSIQFKSLFLESLFFSLSLKVSKNKVDPKFAELVYHMDKRRESINNFLCQNRDFKIKAETKNDVIETLMNTIRNINIDKIKKESANTGKTRPYELLVVELEELLGKIKNLDVNNGLSKDANAG